MVKGASPFHLTAALFTGFIINFVNQWVDI